MGRTRHRARSLKAVIITVLSFFFVNTVYLGSLLSSREALGDFATTTTTTTSKVDLGSKDLPIQGDSGQANTKEDSADEETNDKGGTTSKRRRTTSLLNCTQYGGPFDRKALDEMVYWKEIPADLHYRSKFVSSKQDERFLTFDTDMSGFNNQRMVFEINLAVAVLTGRTLVLPRDRLVDHIHEGNRKFNMEDFFDLKGIAARMPDVLKFIHVDDFLRNEGGPDQLDIPNNFTRFLDEQLPRFLAQPSLVQNASHHDRFLWENRKQLSCNVAKLGREACSNYTNWIDQRHTTANGYFRYFFDEYFYQHPKVACPKWGAQTCLLGIPGTSAPRETFRERIQSWLKGLAETDFSVRRSQLIGNPKQVNDPPKVRLEEVLQMRKALCPYDTNMEAIKYYHMRDDASEETRLMGHFYDYLFLEDWKEDLWLKRFMRDQLRYNDQLQCAAARIVASLQEEARKQEIKAFHSFHMRRTDLVKAYKDFDVERNASQILHDFTFQSFPIIPRDSIVYIATDEPDKKYFDSFREHYRKVYFLDDFSDSHLRNVPKEFYGMIDQLVASKGKHFVGTYYSTFTGYINRLRGYHSSSKNDDDQGAIESWFFAPSGRQNVYQRYEPISFSFFEMEYALAWRKIDFDVENNIINNIINNNINNNNNNTTD